MRGSPRLNRLPGQGFRLATCVVILALCLSTLGPLAARAEAAEGAGTIRGTLVDRAGQPLAGYKVRVIDSTGRPVESQPTDLDGSFEIPDLPAGTYNYEILDPEGNTIVVKIPPVTLLAGTVVTQPIAIIPSDDKPGSVARWAVPVSALAVLTALIVINNQDDDHDDNPPPMTGSGTP